MFSIDFYNQECLIDNMIRDIVLAVVVISLIMVSGCSQEVSRTAEKGVLEGRVTIGPICPVERFPPEPGCQPTEDTYKAWPIAVYESDGKAKVAQIWPGIDGAYSLELPAGEYIVDFEKKTLGLGGGSLPADIIIVAGKTTTLDIDIDTGIR